MSEPILHDRLPNPPWLEPTRWRLPGVLPLALEDWLIRDEMFAPQMALRDRLISECQGDVHALLPEALPAAQECFDLVLEALGQDKGYRVEAGRVVRPDGAGVSLDRSRPLITLGRLIQADLCIMQPAEDEHVLTGAILCFPAYWTLREKIGKPLMRVHRPVPEYDADMGKRVQRLFDAIRPDRLLWRTNANLHASPELFTPKMEDAPDSRVPPGAMAFVRSERQVLRKLPRTGATIFSIHTYMVRVADLDAEAKAEIAKLSL
ncbi:MAG: DUF3445 domain-containing protein [Pseudomonadota bacterium]